MDLKNQQTNSDVETNTESNNNEEEMQSNWDQFVETFDELGLKKDLLRGI